MVLFSLIKKNQFEKKNAIKLGNMSF